MGEDEAKRLKRTHYIINNAVMSSGTHIVVFVCTVAFACSHSPGGLVCFFIKSPCYPACSVHNEHPQGFLVKH